MLFNTMLLLASSATSATATVKECVDGHTFIHWGPNNEGKVAQYELPTYQFALDLLQDHLSEAEGGYSRRHGAPASVPPRRKSLHRLKRELWALKEHLGADHMQELLQPDIEDANDFWHDIISNSTPNAAYVPADAHGVGFLPNITAATFAAWTQSPFADAVNNMVNAEHYFKRTVVLESGHLAAEILEGWGGVTTVFNIPNYGPPGALGYGDFLRPLPEFSIQAAGDKVLSDGSGDVFGVLHISIRDVDGVEFGEGEGTKGVEVFSTVWYGDALGDGFLEEERQHMVVEIVRLMLAAQRDVEEGNFPMV